MPENHDGPPQSWVGPLSAQRLDEPQNVLLFGRVQIQLHGAKEDVALAYSALLLLQDKIGREALTPDRILPLLRS
jgi:hypothetical protein